jgi:hypothetical protein
MSHTPFSPREIDILRRLARWVELAREESDS